MSKSCILACDIGTSSVKTAIFQADGNMIASAVQPHATYYQQPGWAGQNPQDWWQGFQRNMQDLLEQAPEIRNRIAVIGVSGHMLGCLPVDGSGQPLYQALIHADNRAVAQNLQISDSIGAAPLYALTGNILEPRSSLCKMLWFKQQEPAIYKRTGAISPVQGLPGGAPDRQHRYDRSLRRLPCPSGSTSTNAPT